MPSKAKVYAVDRREDRKGRPYVVRWDDLTGKRRQKQFGKDKAAAEEFAAKLTLELTGRAVGLAGVSSQITVQDFAFPMWLDHARAGLKFNTWRHYRNNLVSHVLPRFGAWRVRDIEAHHVRDWLNDKYRAGFAVSTIKGMQRTLSALLAEALFQRVVTHNAAHGVLRKLAIPRAERSEANRQVKALTLEERGRFLEAAQGDQRFAFLFLLLFESGLRLGEVIGLQLVDVDVEDLDNATVTVERTVLSPMKGLTFEQRVTNLPKGNRSREVELGPACAAELRSYVTARRAQELSRPPEKRSEWLFANSDGMPWDANVIRDAFKAAARRAGLPRHLAPHTTRDTFATLALMDGADPTWVSQQLGHTNPTTTFRFYWFAIPDKRRPKYAAILEQQRRAAAQPAAVAVGDESVTTRDQSPPEAAPKSLIPFGRPATDAPKPAYYESPGVLPAWNAGGTGSREPTSDSTTHTAAIAAQASAPSP